MKIFLWVLASLVMLFLAGSIYWWYTNKNIEEPEYTVIQKKPGYEIREYPAYIIIETEMSGDNLNRTFPILAGYIFGNNTKNGRPMEIAMTKPVITTSEEIAQKISEKIAMTKPVLTDKLNSNPNAPATMSFILPAKYKLEDLPTPNDSRVKIKEVDEAKWAVLTYSWNRSRSEAERKLDLLRERLEKDGVNFSEEFKIANYNPPWVLPFLLRNEVWIKIVD